MVQFVSMVAGEPFFLLFAFTCHPYNLQYSLSPSLFFLIFFIPYLPIPSLFHSSPFFPSSPFYYLMYFSLPPVSTVSLFLHFTISLPLSLPFSLLSLSVTFRLVQKEEMQNAERKEWSEKGKNNTRGRREEWSRRKKGRHDTSPVAASISFLRPN